MRDDPTTTCPLCQAAGRPSRVQSLSYGASSDWYQWEENVTVRHTTRVTLSRCTTCGLRWQHGWQHFPPERVPGVEVR